MVGVSPENHQSFELLVCETPRFFRKRYSGPLRLEAHARITAR
jgi:hypothetical protein